MRSFPRNVRGVSLVELMVAIALATLLLLVIAQVFSATKASYRAQDGVSRVQEAGRFATDYIQYHLRQAGYVPIDLVNSPNLAQLILPATADGGGSASDTLGFAYLANTDCQDNNSGNFLTKTLLFSVTANELRVTCTYNTVVQINDQVLAAPVDSFQVLYGEDLNADQGVDRWVTANTWNSPNRIIAARFGVLVRSPESVPGTDTQNYNLLDATIAAANDSFVRKPFVGQATLRNQAP